MLNFILGFASGAAAVGVLLLFINRERVLWWVAKLFGANIQ